MTTHLHIERIVLDASLLQGERPELIRAEFERELARALAARGVNPALLRSGRSVALKPGALPPSTGAQRGLGARLASVIGASLASQHG